MVESDVNDKDKHAIRPIIESHNSYTSSIHLKCLLRDVIVGEFSCYLVRLVTLPGWLYITKTSICFFAPLPGKEHAPYRSGYISKKNHRTSPCSYRYHFVLSNHVLSWYNSAENHYEPLGNIKIEDVIDVRASKSRKYGFKIITPAKKYHFTTDSHLSLKEWVDDLRRDMFIAKNDGNSVRITLPFTKITSIQKLSEVNFVEYIKLDISDEDGYKDTNDSYYFSFFPDIDKVYEIISSYWQVYHPDKIEDNKSDASNAILIDVADSSEIVAQLTKRLEDSTIGNYDDTSINTSLKKESADHIQNNSEAPLNKAFKRFSNTITKTLTSPSSANASSTASSSVASTNEINSNTDSATPSNASTNNIHESLGSGSFKKIKYFATLPFHITNKEHIQSLLNSHHQEKNDETKNINKIYTHSASSPTSQEGVSDYDLNKNEKLSSKDEFARDDSNSKKEVSISSLTIWMSTNLKKSLDMNISSLTNIQSDMESAYQKLLNKNLFKYFPMLNPSESVIAFYRCSVWRHLPYYGTLYMSQSCICFHASVLAGKQRIVIPFEDIVNIRRLKSKGYYLLHGLGIIAKDMNDEIFFEFGSIEYRDSCYALLCFKSNKSWKEQHYSSDSDSDDEDEDEDSDDRYSNIVSKNTIESTTLVHITPPNEYNGPPMLSSCLPFTNNMINQFKPTKSLTITCLTIGSRGDVQPYIALCKELQKQGHHCRIASHGEYQSWVENFDIEFRSIGGDPGQLMKLCIDNGFLSYYFIKNGYKFFYDWFETLLEASWEACQGTDILIESPSAMVGIHLAEKLEIPYFRSMPFPWTRTTKFPHPFAVSTYGAGRVYNDMTYVMIDMALWAGTSKLINRFRSEKLGLAPTTLDKLELWKVPYLYSFSPLVVPPPKDWPDYVHCTGYWFLDEKKLSIKTKWEPTDELLDFLHLKEKNDDNRPIVYIGFGSIIVPDSDAITKVIVDAVLQTNIRAIICKGWSSRIVSTADSNDQKNNNVKKEENESSDILQLYPGTIFKLDSVPHGWLFPKIHGVLAHGGAGTVAASLRAGLPIIVKPFFGDQTFWGKRIEELGVGMCLSKLTTDKLKESLTTITTNKVMINKAKLLGESIRQENGTKKAVESIYHDMELAKRTRISETADNLDNEMTLSNRLSIYSYTSKLKNIPFIGADDNNDNNTNTTTNTNDNHNSQSA
ncbi:unnamed protein product [Cunninghamella blakesleeana]